MRDQRDPQLCGLAYLRARKMGAEIEDAVLAPAKPYADGGHISSDPAEHHSKTPQNIGDLDDVGAS